MTEAARYASLSMGHDMLRQVKKSYEVDLPDLASVSRKKVSLDFAVDSIDSKQQFLFL